MLLIYGLGNNEPKYLQTKHNAGRVLVEKLAKDLNLSFHSQKTYSVAKNNKLFLVYSNGYMNTSGLPLAQCANYYKLGAETRVIVSHDDSDQLIGNQKFLPKGGTAGHKGIIDIYKQLPGTQLQIDKLWRLKIGIRPIENKLRSETFVLKSMTDQELQRIDLIADKILNNFSLLESDTWDKIQNLINSL